MTNSAEQTRRSKSPLGNEHPIVRLDYFVRLFGCPLPAAIVAFLRLSSSQATPLGIWIALIIYALIWPHAAFFLARRGRDPRAREMRLLVVDCAVVGAAMALSSFETLPTLAVLTGCATMAASVGGVPLLLIGLATAISSAIITGATLTDFTVVQQHYTVSTIIAALTVFGFQTMMGLLTHRTARNFVRSRRRIAEQAEEISRQNDALVKAREEALQAAQAKAAFLATMSHEIRTPLNGVIGMTRLLAETPLTSEQQDFVRTIQVSGTTLLTVINDILEYSRIESGRLELEKEPLLVREVVEEALEIVGERARDRGLDLICEIDPGVPDMILGDVTRLRQVLTNLVANAVKFTERGEVVVTVRQRSEETSDAQAELEFSVRDTGIGIPEDRIGLLFTPFTQADASTTRRYGGTGLGLAICRRLTELMGGTVSVKSIAGEGSTFTFTIRASLPEKVAEVPLEQAASLAGRRVLVVDDNATNRRVLSRQLAAWGIEAVTAASAPDALGALGDDKPFALAILDLHMPDVDGLMLARRIHDQRRHHDLPLILLSSSLVQRKDDPDRLFSVRLLKPVRQSKLYDSLVRVVAGGAGRHADRTDPGIQLVPITTPMNVLVADDNDINRNLARLVLRRFGYEVDFATNGAEAVAAVQQRAATDEPYDLVFMDVQMPEVDGLEATRRIRRLQSEQPEKAWPRIVAMTADAMPEDREVCLRAGMDDYLTKPLDFGAVRAVLEQTANNVAAQQPPPVPKADPPAAAMMDWSRLTELREYDTPEGEIVKGAIGSFIEQAPAKLQILRSSAGARDRDALRASAHALKGVAMNIGATAVAEQAKHVEEAAKQNALDGVESMVDNLAAALAQTLAELQNAEQRLGAR
jgi:signal transduction histidine kinase/DNA-binding response OmpR family regulator